MKNRWSDAARLAALAVRQARAFAANPDKGNAVPQPGGRAPKPMAPNPAVYKGGSATFDETTGKRNNTEMNVWIPPPNDPHWNDPAFVESFKRGVAERKKTGLTTATFPTKPNIFYSSSVPGPLDRQAQGILRYDPKNPLDASKLGYNMGDSKKSMPPKQPPGGGTGTKKRTEGTRYIIGGKRYTKVGNKLVPDVVAPGEKTKIFYMK